MGDGQRELPLTHDNNGWRHHLMQGSHVSQTGRAARASSAAIYRVRLRLLRARSAVRSPQAR